MEQPKEDIGTKKDLVLYRLQTARSDLKSAKILLAAEEYKGANNRAYYSIFYAIKAVLAIEKKDFKRHKDVIAYFNKEYVATEIFQRELGRKLGTLKQLREKSDYDDFYIASKEKAEEQIETAQAVIKSVIEYLGK